MNFLQNMDSQFVIWAAIGVLVLLGILVVNNKLRRVAAFGMHAALGIAAVFALNFLLDWFGLAVAVGINAITIGVVALLGLPGVVMLYGLAFML